MDTQEQALRVAKEVFAYYVLGDTAGMLEHVHADAFFRFPGDPKVIPWGGEYVGRDIARFHERVKNTVDVLESTAYRFEPAGDKVLIFAHERFRVKATGKIFQNDLMGVATIEDGKVRRYLEYSDLAEAHAAFAE